MRLSISRKRMGVDPRRLRAFRGFSRASFLSRLLGRFFRRRHYVLKGASPRTAALLTRATFRNWFRPDYPYMYAGFRVLVV